MLMEQGMKVKEPICKTRIEPRRAARFIGLSGDLLNLSASLSQHCGQNIFRHHLINLTMHVLSAITACRYHDDYRRAREDEDFIPAIPAAIESLISFVV